MEYVHIPGGVSDKLLAERPVGSIQQYWRAAVRGAGSGHVVGAFRLGLEQRKPAGWVRLGLRGLDPAFSEGLRSLCRRRSIVNNAQKKRDEL